MDGHQFDDLLRIALTSRRSVLGLALAFSGVITTHELAAAKKKKKNKKPCPPCKTRKHGKCKGTLPDGTGCSGGTCQGGSCLAPTCTPPDGITNGTETGVDCGGLCPRCANGQPCTSRDDCRSAFCANGLCQECAPGLCGSDGNGSCGCTIAKGSGQFVCRTAKGTPNSSCLCPPGTSCFNVMAQDGCYALCGAI
jgi:hypothetical protein